MPDTRSRDVAADPILAPEAGTTTPNAATPSKPQTPSSPAAAAVSASIADIQDQIVAMQAVIQAQAQTSAAVVAQQLAAATQRPPHAHATAGNKFQLSSEDLHRLEMNVKNFAEKVIAPMLPSDGDQSTYNQHLTGMLAAGKREWGGPFATLCTIIAKALGWPTEVQVQQQTPKLSSDLESLIAGARNVEIIGTSKPVGSNAGGHVQQSQISFKSSAGRDCKSLGDLNGFETTLDGLLHRDFVREMLRFLPALQHIGGIPIETVMKQQSFVFAVVVFHKEIYSRKLLAKHAAVNSLLLKLQEIKNADSLKGSLDAAGAAHQIIATAGIVINDILNSAIAAQTSDHPDLHAVVSEALDKAPDTSAPKLISLITTAANTRGVSLGGDMVKQPVNYGAAPPATGTKVVPCRRCGALQRPGTNEKGQQEGHDAGHKCFATTAFNPITGKRDPKGKKLDPSTIGSKVTLADIPAGIRSYIEFKNLDGWKPKKPSVPVHQATTAPIASSSDAQDYYQRFFGGATSSTNMFRILPNSGGDVPSANSDPPDEHVSGDTFEECARAFMTQQAQRRSEDPRNSVVDTVRGRFQIRGLVTRDNVRKNTEALKATGAAGKNAAADVLKSDGAQGDPEFMHGTNHKLMPLRLIRPVTVAAATHPVFDFKAAVTDLIKHVQGGTGDGTTNEKEIHAIRDDSMQAYGVDPNTLRLALTRQKDGLKLAGNEQECLRLFQNAMQSVEAVLSRLPCKYDQWRRNVMAAQTHSRTPQQSSTSKAPEAGTDVVVDSGAAGSIVSHLDSKDTSDKLICEAINKTTSKTTGSSAVSFDVLNTSGRKVTIKLRKVHELPGAAMPIVSLYDLRKEGCQFHMNEKDMYILAPDGSQIPCNFKERIVTFRLASSMSTN